MQRIAQLCGLLLVGLLLGPGCGADRAIPNLGANTPQPEGDTIKIGMVTVLTGDLANSGRVDANAAQLAVEQVNAAGGILGRRVELIIKDYAANNDEAKRLAQELIDQGAVALLAAEGSGASAKALEATVPAKIPILSCCSTASTLTNPANDGFFFRTAPSDAVQARVVVDLVKGTEVPAAFPGLKRGAVVYIDNGYGQSFRESLTQEFRTVTDVSLLDYFPYDENAGDNELGQVVQQIVGRDNAEMPIDFIILVGYDVSGGRFVNAWYRLTGQREVFWVPTDGILSNAFVDTVKTASPQAFTKLLGTAPAAVPGTPDYEYFDSTYRATFPGSDPTASAFAPHEYDAAMLLLLAIQAAGSTEGPAIRDGLRRVSRKDGGEQIYGPATVAKALEQIAAGKDINYDGASGAVDFDANGDVVSGYQIWQITGNPPAISPKRFIDPAVLLQ